MTTIVKGAREASRSVRSRMETLIFSAREVALWQIPPFQRPLRVNDKVRGLAQDLKKNGGIISGTITLGKISGDPVTYLVDGQHRMEAFRLSELAECIADVRICSFEDVAEMADEFVNVNSSLVNMKPDDIA